MQNWITRAALLLMVALGLGFAALTSRTADAALQHHRYLPLLASDSAPAAPSGSIGAEYVDDLQSATTAGARQQVLYELFGALGIGVYRSDGTPIVAGAETGPDDFYLYQGEVELLASSFEQGDRWSFDDLATFLNAPGLLADGESVTAAEIQATVAAVVAQAAAHARDQAWLSPLVVRELGFAHSPANDLTQPGDTSEPALDAVQRELILLDFLLGLPRTGDRVAATSALVEASGGVLQHVPVAAQGTCGDFKGTKVGRDLGKFAAGFQETAGKVIQVITIPLDASHGVSLALGVVVEPLADNLKTHYGHENPGQALAFPVRVRMLDQLTETQIDCGWLAGITYPAQGPIPNVKVDWDSGTLANHGTIECPLDCQNTNADGIATLRFQPKQEATPYGGTLTSEHGRVEANALYLSSLGNMFGPVNEAATPKLADFVWEVEWHAKGSWAGQVTINWDQDGQVVNSTTDVRFDLSLASPGEGDTHTNVYSLTTGTVNWAQTVEGCQPETKEGETSLDPGSTDLTVTETDGQMTYDFNMHDSKHEFYAITCKDDDPVTIQVPVFGVLFPFPVSGADSLEFHGGPVAAGNVITGSTTLVEEDATITWTWKLTRQD